MKIILSTIKNNININNRKNKNNKVALSKLQNDSFNYVTSPNFQGLKCSEGKFKIKEIHNLRCPVCDLVMLNDNEQKAFVAEIQGKKGNDLANTLEKYQNESVIMQNKSKSKNKTLFREQRQKIVDIIKDLARKNPSMTLAQLVQLQAKQSLKTLIEEQMIVVDELENYIQNYLDDEELHKTQIIVEEYKNQINGKSDTQFKRKNFIHALSGVSSNPKTQNVINSIISKLPTSDTGVDSFFVKYSQVGRTSKEIAMRLISQSKPTAEHLVPKSKGGKNNTSNYICDCSNCNSSRGSMPFSQWLKEQPQLKENLQEYLQHVQEALDSGELPLEYDGYIEEIINTISDLSNGELQLKITESKNNEIQRAQILKRKEQLDEVQCKLTELYKKRKELKTEISHLEEHPQFRNIIQYQIIQTQMKEIANNITKANQELNKLKEKAFKLNNEFDITSALLEDYRLNPSLYDEEEVLEQTQGKTPQEIEKEKEENANEQQKIKARINALNSQYEELSKKKKIISDLISIEHLEDEIKRYKEQLAEISKITEEIKLLLKSIFDEEILSERLAYIFEENQIYSDEIHNAEQENEEGFDRTKYEEYLELENLYDIATSMQEKNGSDLKHKRITQIAQDSIADTIYTLSEDNSVRYYQAIDSLKKNSAEEELIAQRLKEIDAVKQKIAELEGRLHALIQGKTISEIEASYNSLIDEQNQINKIKNISDIRSEVEMLEDTIAYNRSILKQLKNYRNLTSDEFKRLISLVY